MSGRREGKTGPIARSVRRSIKEYLSLGGRSSWPYQFPTACGHDWFVEYFAGERPAWFPGQDPHIMFRHIEAKRADERVTNGRA